MEQSLSPNPNAALSLLESIAQPNQERDRSLDRLTRLAARYLGVPVTSVSLVGYDRQYFISSVGIFDPWVSERTAPLSHSFCKYVVGSADTLIVEDARVHPLVCANPAIVDMEVIAYAGLPLRMKDGTTVGAFVAVDHQPRAWSAEDIELLGEFARIASAELDHYAHKSVLASEVERQITERLRAESALRHSERRYQAITEAALVGIISCDADGTILSWNPAAERIFGYRADEIVGRSSLLLLPAMFHDANQYAMERILGRTVEVEGMRKGGACFPIELSLGTWINDGQTFYSAIVRDISQQKLIADELRARDELLRSAFDDAAIGMALVGLDGRWLRVNRAITEIVGYSKEELGRIDFQTITHPDDLEIDLQHLRDVLANNRQSYQIEKRYLRKDGQIVWILLHVSVVRDAEGRPMHFVSQVQDISERKRVLEELEQARVAAERGNRAKSQFMATMSHEFRTPLHAIVGMTDLLASTPLADEQRSYTATTRDAALALEGTLGDILEFVTIESDAVTLQPRPFKPRAVVADIVDAMRQRCAAKQVHLQFSANHDLPPRVVGDDTRWGQIVERVLGNAVKFTERGEITATVRCSDARAERPTLEVEIRDTGIGLPEGDLDRLLLPFTQGDSSWSRRYGGLGLGLAIAHRLTMAMGGTITMTRNEGMGSTFTIQIPFEREKIPEAAPTPTLVRNDARSESGTILVAEDNQVNQRLVMIQLRKLGYNAQSVSDGLAAVEAIKQHEYALILMDCQMPNMDGLTATRTIRELERTTPGAGHVPIIALTANAMDGDREICLGAGMDDYIAKPARVELLDRVIQRWMQG